MASPAEPGTVSGPLVIDIPDYVSPYDLDSYLSEVDSESSRSATSYVFRVPLTLQQELLAKETEDARHDLRRRTPKTLRFLSYEPSGFALLEMQADASVASASTTLIDEIRQADLRRVVRECEDDCYYPATAKHHFVAPSLKHLMDPLVSVA